MPKPDEARPAARRLPRPPPPPPANRRPSSRAEAAENIARQQLTNDVEQRLGSARALLESGQPEAAINALRFHKTLCGRQPTSPKQTGPSSTAASRPR